MHKVEKTICREREREIKSKYVLKRNVITQETIVANTKSFFQGWCVFSLMKVIKLQFLLISFRERVHSTPP